MEMHARESLDCLEETIGRNSGVNHDFGESSERKRRTVRESFCHLREYIYHEQHVAEIRMLKAILMRSQTEMRNMFELEKGDPCNEVAELAVSVEWKVGLEVITLDI